MKELSIRFGSNVADEIFPELKESEDERIRIELLNYLYDVHDDDEERASWITWLEKQGEQKLTPIFRIGDTIIAKDGTYIEKEPFHIDMIEDDCYWDGENTILVCNQDKFEIFKQKPTDKIEPKFKVGDWIIDNNVKTPFLITGISNEKYDVISIYGNDMAFSFREVEHFYHLWTIQDAKDGDVLFTSSTASHETFIFKNIDERGNVECYFAYDSEDGFREGKHHFIGSATNCKPATKEQYDALMKAMSDAGYTFDFEKKKLKEIVDKRQIKKNLQDNSFRRMFEQKTAAWSEEDEIFTKSIINDVWMEVLHGNVAEGIGNDKINWLKSLKDRVLPQQEWSDEDERNASYICAALECYYRLREERNNTNGQEDLNKARNWLYNKLKSLRPQSQWKPSDIQLECLSDAIKHYNSLGYPASKLQELLDDLMKLRDE